MKLTVTARKYQLVSALNALVVHGLTLDAPFLSVAATLHGRHRRCTNLSCLEFMCFSGFALRIHTIC
jgi:hypothetical protein